MTEKEQELIDRLSRYIYTHDVSNRCMVEMIKLLGSFLNIQKVSDYSKEFAISPQGIYKCREVEDIWGYKFVIDNE